MLVCALLVHNFAHETAGAARTRSSLHPLIGEGGKFMNSSRKKHAARSRNYIRVIASKAKQSISPSKERMDCFVARAPRNDGGMGESEILPGEIHSNDGFNDIRPT